MIEIRNLSKHFGAFRAVDDITFRVSPGEVLGFLGPNGAGKSTTMKMVTGFLAPTAGRAVVCGHDVVREPQAIKRRIGYLPEGAPLYPDMTPESLLAFVADIRGMKGEAKTRRMREVIDLVDLGEVLGKRIETLSKGFKRRVGLAQAILHDPEVLVLDEPTDGLDPNQKHEVRRLIREMAPGKVIVLSTHILEEVEAVCTRAIIIARPPSGGTGTGGRLCFDGTPQDLRTRSRWYNAVVLTLRSQTSRGAAEILAELPGVAKVEAHGAEDGFTSYVLFPRGQQSVVQEVSQFAHSRGWEVEHLHVESGRLDDVFRKITTGVEESEYTVPGRRGGARAPAATQAAQAN